MAFRIHESVVRGEIDNREKGIVRGKIWVAGRDEPILLDLAGNAHPDLAGCVLTFTNPLEAVRHPHLEILAPLQRGAVGDLTASRKVRVFDVPFQEAMEMYERKEKPPEHIANCLYLEWFSERNGRVVIESPDFELVMSAPEWRLTPEEEEQRARDVAAGMAGFMQHLTEAIEEQQRGQKNPDEPWDEHDYERLFKESDARTEKYAELLDKYGDSEEARKKIDEEMGWTNGDESDAEDGAEGSGEFDVEDAEPDLVEPEPDPAREGIDWIRTEDGELCHPLQRRCSDSAIRVWQAAEALGLEGTEDEDLADLIFEFQTTGVKLAGALHVIAEGLEPFDPAFTVAYLKRALDHLHKAQRALEMVMPKKLLPVETLAEARRELFEIREGILRLMEEFRRES